MILNIDPLKSFIASVLSTSIGITLDSVTELMLNIPVQPVDSLFKYASLTVGFLAGLISAINGFMNMQDKFRKRREAKTTGHE